MDWFSFSNGYLTRSLEMFWRTMIQSFSTLIKWLMMLVPHKPSYLYFLIEPITLSWESSVRIWEISQLDFLLVRREWLLESVKESDKLTTASKLKVLSLLKKTRATKEQEMHSISYHTCLSMVNYTSLMASRKDPFPLENALKRTGSVLQEVKFSSASRNTQLVRLDSTYSLWLETRFNSLSRRLKTLTLCKTLSLES